MKKNIYGKQILRVFFTIPYFNSTIESMFYLGVNTLPVLIIVSAFAGMTSAIQFYSTFNKIGGTYTVGIFITYAALRELGPIMAAAVVAGKGGALLTSNISFMKDTSQIKAMESLAIDPVKYILAPNIWAAIIITPIMVVISAITMIIASLITYIYQLNGTLGTFNKNFIDYSSMTDLTNGLIKGVTFGIIIGIVTGIIGLTSKKGPDGVGGATRKAIVLIIIFSLIANTILSIIFYGGKYFR